MSILLDPAAGQAVIGSQTFPLRLSGRDGALQINGAAGPVLRPLPFNERTRLLSYAAAAPNPAAAAGQLIAEAALEQPGAADPLVVQIVALALAGAQEQKQEADLPSFAAAALLLARTAGWTPTQLEQAAAQEVDRLVASLLPAADPDDGGWVRLVLDRPAANLPPADPEEELTEIHDRLAGSLLRRLRPDPAGQPPPGDAGRSRPAPVRNETSSPPQPNAADNPSQRPRWRFFQPQNGRNSGQKPPAESGERTADSQQRTTSPTAPPASREAAVEPGAAAPLTLTRHDPPPPAASGPIPLRAAAAAGSSRSTAGPAAGADPAGLQAVPLARPASAQIQPFERAAAASTAPPLWENPRFSPPPHLPAETGPSQDQPLSPPWPSSAAPLRGAPATASLPTRPAAIPLEEILDELAARLHLEADLRGIDR